MISTLPRILNAGNTGSDANVSSNPWTLTVDMGRRGLLTGTLKDNGQAQLSAKLSIFLKAVLQ